MYYCVLNRIALLENEENLLKKKSGQKKTWECHNQVLHA